MIEQRVTLRYDAQQIPAIVQAVQGDTGRDVIFELADYEIPAGATANYYIDKPDGNAVYNSAEVISSTEILAHLTEQALAEPGRNNGQVRILADDEVITSFDFVLEVEAFRGILRLQSETEVNIFDQAIEDAVNTATEEAVAEIQAQTPVVTGLQNSIAPTYSSSSTYDVGDYVMYNAQLYRCVTEITTAEAWTAAHWTQVPLANDVNDLKSAFEEIPKKVENHCVIVGSSTGYKYADFPVVAGKMYTVKNNSEGAIVVATVATKSDSASAVDAITGGLLSNNSISFIATANAPYIRVYFVSATGNVTVTEIGTIANTVDNMSETYDNIIHKGVFINSGSQGTLYPFEFVAGHSYRFKNVGSGAVQLKSYTTYPPATVAETISDGFLSGAQLDFTASANASLLYIYSAASSEITVEELGTLYSDFYYSKKDYKSGQIHFTVPVNQIRLYKTQGSTSISQDNENNMVDVNCVLMLPTSYKPIGEKTKLLMICHGSGGGVTGTTWFRDDATVLAFFQKFLDAGYAIFDCNGYTNGSSGQESFGVDTAIIAYHSAYEYVVKNYNVESELNIYGFSMGGLTALNYIDMYPGGIKCIALGAPLVSIYKTVWVDYTVQAKGDVATAYGFANNVTYEPQTVGNCDPYTRIKTIDNTPYCFDTIPTLKVWHGEDDTATSPVYSKDLVDAYVNGGNFAYYRAVPDAGHEICYGGNAIVTGEIIAFLDRFNQ